MVRVIADWLVALPTTWKVLTAALGIFSAGAASSLAMLSFAELPAQLEMTRQGMVNNTAEIMVLEQRLNAQDTKLDRMVCLIELQLEGEVLTPLQVDEACK